jgi:DNA polymerase III alpha subunit
MKIDNFGQYVFSEEEICELYLTNPDRRSRFFLSTDNINLIGLNLEKIPEIRVYNSSEFQSLSEFDNHQQKQYFIPDSYKTLDIAQYVLSLCKTDVEIQRVGQELLLYQELDLFDFLRYLKYLVDILRENNIVWGVGRGSSTSSYVLFLLGIHKINSIYYDLSIDEFLK